MGGTNFFRFPLINSEGTLPGFTKKGGKVVNNVESKENIEFTNE